MKFSLAIICILMICAMDVTAQRISDLPKSQQPQPAPKAEPVQTTSQDSIKFDKTMHDYGTILQGADGNCEFKFTNNGKAPLLLSNVQASCGCTVPEWPKEPILPGKTNSIKVKYNTAIVGVFNKSITVNSNAVNNPVVLQVKGNVTAPKNASTQTQKTTATAALSSVTASGTTNNPTAPTIENARRMNSPQSVNTAPPTSGVKPRLNPQHGEPYHRCDIAVGAPLNSQPANTAIQAPNNQVQAKGSQSSGSGSSVMNNPTAPTIENAKRLNSTQSGNTASSNTGVKPRLNPPHGQPWHRCDIAVASPLP